ncbi:hypothetical protein B0H12DRAFT_171969 [Mycena haematopus]|nr:hypothetical protein B0H12DRAFT_171969 [Mycena haematopus]
MHDTDELSHAPLASRCLSPSAPSSVASYPPSSLADHTAVPSRTIESNARRDGDLGINGLLPMIQANLDRAFLHSAVPSLHFYSYPSCGYPYLFLSCRRMLFFGFPLTLWLPSFADPVPEQGHFNSHSHSRRSTALLNQDVTASSVERTCDYGWRSQRAGRAGTGDFNVVSWIAREKSIQAGINMFRLIGLQRRAMAM